MRSYVAEGREATNETAEEIIERLEAKKNFIPSSKRARRKYAYALQRVPGSIDLVKYISFLDWKLASTQNHLWMGTVSE